MRLKDLTHKTNLRAAKSLSLSGKSLEKEAPYSYGIKNFVRIAYEELHPDVTTFEGIKQHLITWFCLKYETTEKDDRLLDMNVEELMILFQKHKIIDDPKYYDEIINPNKVLDYEDWLKKEMGEDYVTTEQNVEQILQEEQEYTDKIRSQFPDRIDTDFSKFTSEE